MIVPIIGLGLNQVLISPGVSVTGLVSLTNNPTIFGTVAAVNDLCDTVNVGDAVMYDSTKAAKFLYGSTFYDLITEEFISGIETDV